MKNLLRGALGLIVIVFINNCGSNKESLNTDIQPQFSSIYTNILSKNCVGCHSPGGSGFNSGAQIDFSTVSSAYSTLVSGLVHGNSANLGGQCNNVYLVQAGLPNASYLLATLFNDYYHINFVQSGCDPYPPSGHAASVGDDEKKALVGWINAGAQNN